MASGKKASPFAGIRFTPGEVCDVKNPAVYPYPWSLTLDPDTVNKQLTLSEGSNKATHGALQPYPPNPERFDEHPQVFAKGALQDYYSWKVEWSDTPNESVYVGVAYGSIDRKSGDPSTKFGNNSKSWVFGQTREPSWPEPKLSAYHNGLRCEVPLPSGGCKGVQVDLNWRSGNLSFYKISGDQNVRLWQFETTFTEPVFPCFWVGKSGNHVAIVHPVKR